MGTKKAVPLVVAALLAGACTLPKQGPAQHVYLDRHACQDSSITPVLFPDSLPQPELPILTGGTATPDEWVLSLWLYCDTSLSSADPSEPGYSEVGYLGLRSEWSYRGRAPQADVSMLTSVGHEVVMSDKAGAPFTTGSTSAQTTSIVTPSQVVARAAAASQPVEFVMTLSAPDPTASVVLRVTFNPTPDGIVLGSAEFRSQTPPQ